MRPMFVASYRKFLRACLAMQKETSVPARLRRSAPRARGLVCRPRLEELEDRTLLSAVQAVSAATLLAASGSGGPSTGGSVSADGRFVAFQSAALNVVTNDTNGAADVFVRDLVTGTTTLVSANLAGTGTGNGRSFGPAISADGRF